MDLIASSVLRDLETHPTEWIADVRFHKSELIESFYLTVADRPKVCIFISYIYISFLFPFLINLFFPINLNLGIKIIGIFKYDRNRLYG